MNSYPHAVTILTGFLGNTRCPSHWFVDEEGSDFHRIYYIYSGDVYYSAGRQKKKLKADSLFIFPAQRQYSLRHSPENPLCCLWFHAKITPLIKTELIEAKIGKNTPLSYCIKLLEHIVKKPLLAQQADTQLQLLLILINEKLSLHTQYDKRIVNAMQLLQNNLAEKISLEQLARTCNLEKSYFVRLFKAMTGVSPMKFRMQCRIDEAKKCLNRELSIKETAFQTGFSDAKSFAREFKKQLGFSPGHFRDATILP